jgi:hypothetical protein
MAIEVVSGNSHGKVVLVDEKDDGSVVLLVCDEWQPGTELVGPTIVPEPDPPPNEEDGIFPMGVLPMGIERSGTVTLDVTALSPGVHAFASGHFCETAIRLIRMGVQRLALQPQDVQQFGLRACWGSSETGSPRGRVRRRWHQ